MTTSITMRCATLDDAEALLRIYAPYVHETAVSFECEPPTQREFAARIASISERYPYLVAERNGNPVGYAYASPFKGRAAYDWSVEVSVYVDSRERQSGVGRALYEALEDKLSRMGIINLYACIASAAYEDEYLSFDSIRFHEHMGYSTTACFPRVACKFGRWYDIVWMHKSLADHAPNPAPVRFRNLSDCTAESGC